MSRETCKQHLASRHTDHSLPEQPKLTAQSLRLICFFSSHTNLAMNITTLLSTMSVVVQKMESSLIAVLEKEITNKFGKTGVDLMEVHHGSSKGMKAIQVQCSDKVGITPVPQSSLQASNTLAAALFTRTTPGFALAAGFCGKA